MTSGYEVEGGGKESERAVRARARARPRVPPARESARYSSSPPTADWRAVGGG